MTCSVKSNVKSQINKSFVFTNNQTEGGVYNENNKGPNTEHWGTPNMNLQRSERVEPILWTDSAQTVIK